MSGLGDGQDLRRGWAPGHGRAQKWVGGRVMKSLAPDLLGVEKHTHTHTHTHTHPGQLAGAGGRLLPLASLLTFPAALTLGTEAPISFFPDLGS